MLSAGGVSIGLKRNASQYKSLEKKVGVHTRPSKAFCAARVRTFVFPFAVSQSMAGHV